MPRRPLGAYDRKWDLTFTGSWGWGENIAWQGTTGGGAWAASSWASYSFQSGSL